MSTAFEECLSRIRSNEPTLANREEHAVELGVILPLLRWTGWDTGDLTQIYPQRPLPTLSNTGKVDFDLQINGKSRVFIEGKRWNLSLGDGEEKQLREYCVAGKPDMAVLTNGRQWRFYLPPTKKSGKWTDLRQFLVLDLTEGQEKDLEESFRRFLAYSSIQSIRSTRNSALKLYREHISTTAVLKGLRDTWNELSNDKEKLKGVLKSLAHERDILASESQLERFLNSSGSLINVVNDGRATAKHKRIMPASFTFRADGKEVTEPVRYWNELKLGVCKLMHERHPDTFRDVVLGMSSSWFSESANSPSHPQQIGDTGIYVRWGGSGAIRNLCFSIMASFRYPEGSLTIDEKG